MPIIVLLTMLAVMLIVINRVKRLIELKILSSTLFIIALILTATMFLMREEDAKILRERDELEEILLSVDCPCVLSKTFARAVEVNERLMRAKRRNESGWLDSFALDGTSLVLPIDVTTLCDRCKRCSGTINVNGR